ncbi:hypothetical protein J7T55_000544 [Diaporthe amygdali]|uniref:uncharacterized protein n=1 Tax=Phomopsis amygdali TaxID=1214568 RepID=UPI0022FEE7B3|nr:uncharacterized protein J7T55_000544 [Diaporthe amygdali]KAJ0110112.1 hypothetical protein J7T55_000544 [Diaporthe amygdali]
MALITQHRFAKSGLPWLRGWVRSWVQCNGTFQIGLPGCMASDHDAIRWTERRRALLAPPALSAILFFPTPSPTPTPTHSPKPMAHNAAVPGPNSEALYHGGMAQQWSLSTPVRAPSYLAAASYLAIVPRPARLPAAQADPAVLVRQDMVGALE